MNKKLVILNICCFNTPCEITLFSNDGYIIKRIKVNSICSTLCVCTTEKTIKITAKYKNQTIYRSVCIDNTLCKNIFLQFVFNTKLFNRNDTEITLLDANYGFPIEKATLYFNQLTSSYTA